MLLYILGFVSCVGLVVFLALYYEIPEDDPDADRKANK